MNGTRRQAIPQGPAFSLYNKQLIQNHIEVEFKITCGPTRNW